MIITIFNIWMFASVLEGYYEDRMINHNEIYITLPKYACDSMLRSLTHCVDGAEFTQEALEDFEYNANLQDLMFPEMSIKPYWDEHIPMINERCCICYSEESTDCSNMISNFCQDIFMSPSTYEYYFYQKGGRIEGMWL